MKPTLSLDLDNTVADYLLAMRRDMALLAAPGELPWEPMSRGTEPPHVAARRRMITHQPGWWANLPENPLGMAILRAAQEIGYDIQVLSKGPRNHSLAWAEKVQWVDARLHGTPIHLSDDKSKVYSRVLCDDWPEYYEKWLLNRPRGIVIVVAQPWNVGAENHPSRRVIRYDGTNIDQVIVALQRAYDREDGRVYPRPDGDCRGFMAVWAYAASISSDYTGIFPSWGNANLPFECTSGEIPQEAFNEDFVVAWCRIAAMVMDPDVIGGHRDDIQVTWDPEVDLLEWVTKDVLARGLARFHSEQPWDMTGRSR